MNKQVMIDAGSRLVVAVGQPQPGNRNDCTARTTSKINRAAAGATVLADGGALGAQIDAVRVGEDCRSEGLGGAMFQWATAEARRRGCALVQLTTDKTRSGLNLTLGQPALRCGPSTTTRPARRSTFDRRSCSGRRSVHRRAGH